MDEEIMQALGAYSGGKRVLRASRHQEALRNASFH